MKILVRLPNWLGDLVMSAGFCRELYRRFPDAHIHAIVKGPLTGIAAKLPGLQTVIPIGTDVGKSPVDLFRFGRSVSKNGVYDLFFCLPDSFSSALMGWACGCRHRIGYRGELRSPFLTHRFTADASMHRAERYTDLISRYTRIASAPVSVELLSEDRPVSGKHQNVIVVNINSEASSRRMSIPKWVGVLRELVTRTACDIVLIGSVKEQSYTGQLMALLGRNERITDVAGKTSLQELANLLGSARLLISTDSGPAHLANAAGTPTVVLFGAGDERITSPYNKKNCHVIRAPGFTCAPCVSNICRYGDQRCLEVITPESVIAAALPLLEKKPL